MRTGSSSGRDTARTAACSNGFSSAAITKCTPKDTPLGRLPEVADLDLAGLEMPAANLAKLLSVDVEGWRAEVPLIEKHFAQFGEHLPQGLKEEVKNLARRLDEAK